LDSGFGVTVIACAWEVDAHGTRSCDPTDTEVSELQRLVLRKRGRRLVGLELIEGVKTQTSPCTTKHSYKFMYLHRGIPDLDQLARQKILQAVACQRFDTASVTQ
jgi:hypothetical protein